RPWRRSRHLLHLRLTAVGATEQRSETAMSLGQLRLALQKLAHLALHELLVEQLAAGDAVDLRAQGGNPIFIGLLHPRLPRNRGADQVVAQDEVGGGEQVSN